MNRAHEPERNSRRPRAIAIVGTNASGKSEIGVAVALALGGEIVSADSRQVYRGFDLCSGKVPPDASRDVPHHMIDVVDAPSQFTLFDYLAGARIVLRRLAAPSRLPVVVGGTPLYAEALVRGYVLRGAGPGALEREELEARSNAELVSELENLFPGEAVRIGTSNHRRLVRAVERARLGLSYSATHEASPEFDWRIFGVTWPMPELEVRIRTRLLRRLEAGMVGEVEAALDGGVPRQFLWDLGLEYRYVLRYIEGDFVSHDEFVDSLARAIRRFAKRQLSWFRRWPDILWTTGTLEERAAAIVATTHAWLSASSSSSTIGDAASAPSPR